MNKMIWIVGILVILFSASAIGCTSATLRNDYNQTPGTSEFKNVITPSKTLRITGRRTGPNTVTTPIPHRPCLCPACKAKAMLTIPPKPAGKFIPGHHGLSTRKPSRWIIKKEGGTYDVREYPR
jgi:hypothetical protein